MLYFCNNHKRYWHFEKFIMPIFIINKGKIRNFRFLKVIEMVVEWKFLDDGTMSVKTPAVDGEQILPKYIADVFKTKEIIRTQDITQNGYSSVDMPSLDENTRWGHLIMVVQLMRPFLQKVKNILEENNIEVDEEEMEIAEIVFASHDVGHTDNSHQSEGILKYSHEQRTIDILLGNTELGRLICSKYPREKVERVVQIITNIDINQGNIPKEKLSPFLQLYAQLVCSGGDLDKVAYTMGDTTYAGVKSSLNPKKLQDSFGIGIDASGNYILHWGEEGQRQLEILDIERFQNYRDIYFIPSAEIMRNMEPVMLTLVEQESDQVKQKLPSPFLNKIKASKSETRITTLEQELEMTNSPMNMAWSILAQEANNPVLRYLADLIGSRTDYHFFESDRDVNEILAQLQEIFPDKDLLKTNSLFAVTSKCKMIKPAEDPWIQTRNGDLKKASEKAGCLIKPENFVRRRIFFNPELLRLELNMTKEQFAEYEFDLDWILDDLVPTEDEFQAKYILKSGRDVKIENFIEFMKQHGFSYDGIKFEQNEDDYFETESLDLLKSGKEFRIRKSSSGGTDVKNYVDYKETISDGEFSHRRSIKTSIKPGMTVDDVESIIKHRAGESFDLKDGTFMHVSTSRSKLYFSRNGKKIVVSWDPSIYDNKWLGETSDDIMLEIKSRGENSDRLILKGVQQVMEDQDDFERYNGTKVSRGSYLTYQKNKLKREKVSDKSNDNQNVHGEDELKCKFKEKDRKQVTEILREVLDSLNINPLTDITEKYQLDEYYDTPDYQLAKKKESLRVRNSKGKIVGTYKTPKKHSKALTSRNEMNISVQENSARALIDGASNQYAVSLPSDIDSVVQVENKRIKQDFSAFGIPLEVSIDEVNNVDLKTGRRKHSDFGEFEIEFKEDVPPEKADELMNRIYSNVLRRCAERGIMIKKSEYSKYIDALLDLELIEDANKFFSLDD